MGVPRIPVVLENPSELTTCINNEHYGDSVTKNWDLW